MKAWILFWVMIVLLAPTWAEAQRSRAGLHPAVSSRSSVIYGRNHPAVSRRTASSFSNREIPQGVNPVLYNPYFSIYYGPLYEPYDEPCYYDEAYGQWVGPCNTSLDTPGYSITVPNRIRR